VGWTRGPTVKDPQNVIRILRDIYHLNERTEDRDNAKPKMVPPVMWVASLLVFIPEWRRIFV
jgi:hypothetical protein